jgi:hypothetical protein
MVIRLLTVSTAHALSHPCRIGEHRLVETSSAGDGVTVGGSCAHHVQMDESEGGGTVGEAGGGSGGAAVQWGKMGRL